jgi:hypothetical protein
MGGRLRIRTILVAFMVIATPAYALDTSVLPGQSPCALCSPSFYAGYGGNHRGLIIEAVDVPATSAELTVDRAWEGNLGAAWFALMAPLAITDTLGVRGSGAILLPHTAKGRQFTEFGEVEPDVKAKSYFWDVAGYCQIDGSWKVLAGFRWDYVEAQFFRKQTVLTGLGGMRRDGVHRFEITTYLPYVGLEANYSSSRGNLTIGALGFPIAPGIFKEAVGDASDLGVLGMLVTSSENPLSVRSGYFADLYFKYSMRLLGAGALGGFAEWNTIRGRTKDITTDIRNAGTGFFALGGGPSNPHTYGYSFQKQTWTVGGFVTLDFVADPVVLIGQVFSR